MKLCDYGCGKEAKHQFKYGKWCCGSNYQKCPEGKRLNPRTEKWKQNHSKIMKGCTPWHKGLTGIFKHTEENKKRASERMKKNNPMKNPETVLKNVETRKRNGTTGLGISKPKKLCEANSIRMKKNNPMKNPETVLKNFRNHNRGKTGPEKYLEKICKKINLNIKYIGDGSIFINGKAPDFIIPESKKLIEVYDSSFLYSGGIRDNHWIKKRRKQLYGYDVLFIDFHIYGKSKNFEKLVKLLKEFIKF